MRKLYVLIAILLSASLLSSGNSTIVNAAKTTMITALPLTGIIDIDDRSHADNFYALQNDGTIWIGNGSKPAIRGPQVPGAVKISGQLILNSTGEVWTWENAGDTPKRIVELSGIKAISSRDASMAINNKGQVYVWGNTCLTSLIRPDFEDNRGLCANAYHNSPTPADDKLASTPKLAIEGAKGIKASLQYIMILMADGKTVKVYGNTTSMSYGMYERVFDKPVVDFDGYDKDYTGYSTYITIPNDISKNAGNYVQVSQAYGGSYKLLLHKDGTVWGDSVWSEDTTRRIAPLKDIIKVAAVAYNSGTALDKYGKVWTWGTRTNIPYQETSEKLLTNVNVKPSLKQLSLRINGKFIVSDPGPIQTNGTTFVPIRSLFESIGAKIGYNNDNITVSYRKQLLAFKVYDTKATLDGKSVVMPPASLSYQGRTYVPLRFLAQALGAKVQWNNNIDGVDVLFPAAG
jgi:hypothetical protein